MDEKQRYDAGLQVRKAVLGEEHVERSLAARTDFTSEFQEFITRTAWGTVWTRDGLPRHTRSLLTLAMMVALGHDEEFKLHVRAARNNGVSADEIKEVLLQAAIYCGVPAANHAFALAKPILEEQAAEG
jgi:4-carboxymuconolactone decarboxylase